VIYREFCSDRPLPNNPGGHSVSCVPPGLVEISMTKKQRQGGARRHPHRTIRKTDWEDAEIVIDIKHTEPGTPLDDQLRRQQTRALLELLNACRDDKVIRIRRLSKIGPGTRSIRLRTPSCALEWARRARGGIAF
jgi:hypothetical protein